MADQETDFQVALLHQLADLADVVMHHKPVVEDDAARSRATAREQDRWTGVRDTIMHVRATAFEANYGGQ